MYICMNCGEVFEQPACKKESRGEYWGSMSYEDVDECPFCGEQDYEEAKKCVRCGEYFSINEHSEICENCIKEYSNFESCYDLVFDDKKEVKISSLIAYLLDEGDIEQILYEHILKRMPDIDCSGYIEKNKDWIVDAIEEEVIKHEQAKG